MPAGEAAGQYAPVPGPGQRRGRRRAVQISRGRPGGARLGCVGWTAVVLPPRCARIRSMTGGSSIRAMTRSRPPHCRHVSISTRWHEAKHQEKAPWGVAKTRFRRWTQVCAGQARFTDQMTGSRPVDDTEHLRDEPGPCRQQVAQRERQRQYPLTNGLLRQDLVHEPCRRLGNCSCIALPRASLHSSTIRRAPQLGQKPRRLHENATSFSAWQASHLTRRKPCSSRPRLR
jgi:hypothetical protein